MTSHQPVYQELLRIPVVYDLFSRAIEKTYGKGQGHPDNRLELVYISGSYYLHDTKDNLIKVQPDAKLVYPSSTKEALGERMHHIFHTFQWYIEHIDDPYSGHFIGNLGYARREFGKICPYLLNSFYSTRPSCIPDPPPYTSS